jgi:hypothetical protein
VGSQNEDIQTHNYIITSLYFLETQKARKKWVLANRIQRNVLSLNSSRQGEMAVFLVTLMKLGVHSTTETVLVTIVRDSIPLMKQC